jgi:hypothetical protein
MPAMTDDRDAITLRLTPAELELVRVGLRVVLSTLGREEADELEEIRDLLARLPPPGAAPATRPDATTSPDAATS